MNVLVIGGSGFLGSHLVDQLLAKNFNVTSFDMKKSEWNNGSFNEVIGDINNLELLNSIMKEVDYVYHFAALSDLNSSINKPIETVKTNIYGTVNVLEACKINNIKRFIYASTVYVNSKEGSFYRCSKQSAEHYIEEYSNEFGLDYTILRFGSLYGPRSNSTNGLFNIVKKALTEKRVSYEGSKDAIREFIHVEDAAISSVKILDDKYINSNLIFTGLESIKVIDLLGILAEILDIEEEVEFIEKKHQKHYIKTPYNYKTNIGRKYIPETHIDLGQGLLQLIDYIKNQ